MTNKMRAYLPENVKNYFVCPIKYVRLHNLIKGSTRGGGMGTFGIYQLIHILQPIPMKQDSRQSKITVNPSV